MNFQQLRYARETVRQGLNLTLVAEKLFTSQPGISKQIKELETELGIQMFVRRGKRLVAVTDPGQAALKIIDRILQETENLRAVSREFIDQDSGTLTIATTHTQARYSLPRVVTEFKRRYPKVHLALQQGNPMQIGEMVSAGNADIGIATEALNSFSKLLALPGYTWTHCVVVPPAHELARAPRITLELLAKYPIVTYDLAFAGRANIDAAFAAKNITPDIVLAAIDADVIKTYAESGLGIGIVASVAYDAERDRGLTMIDASHLFRTNTTRVAIRRDGLLRAYAYEFIELFAPRLTRKAVEAAMKGGSEDYEL
ncbi:MAG: CysB family HTH-type transcriptional regulator [Burkholderiales bacterium]